MILSQRQLEEIAASTTKDFNRFFSGMRLTSPTDLLCQRPLISLQRIISVFAYHSPVSRRTEADRKSTRLNSSHSGESRMPSSA